MANKYSLMMTLICCALLTQGQALAQESSSDPLDVLDAPEQSEPIQPTVPEFTEVPEAGKELAPVTPPPPNPSMVESAPVAPSVSEPRQSVIDPSTGGNEPDYRRESEFNRIYRTYNEQPTPMETWEKAVGARNSEVYQVQKGDTLSGISTVFFGDQHFWPKLWSLNNNKILNPHEISPGMAVQFFPGSMEDAPTLSLGTLADASVVQENATATDAPPLTGVTLPKGRRIVPVLKELPPSLPRSKASPLTSGDNVDLTLDMKRFEFAPAPEYLEYYMTDGPIMGAGVITGTEMDTKTAGDFQYVFVKLNGSSEKNLIVQKNLTQVEDPRVKERKGQMIEIQGELELLEKVNEQQNIYRAIVKKTLTPIEVGALVSAGHLPMIDPSMGPVTGGLGAKIMGGQFDRKRNLFGSNSIVFLDAGSSQGLQVGQHFSIYADARNRNKNSGAVMNDRVIGSLKIVRISQGFATGYVTKAIDDIHVGDYVGRMTEVAVATPVLEAREPNQSFSPSTGGDEFGDDLNAAPGAGPSEDVIPDSGTEDSELEL